MTHKIFKLANIDRSITYTLTSRGWLIVAGFINVILVAHFMSAIQQGFYYTFSSILALQIFFELGLTYVILQFTSHEKVSLQWTSERTIEGNAIAKARLGSLIRMATKWYGIASILLFLCLMPAGHIFFGRSPDATAAGNWQIPWLLLVLSTSGTLFLSPIFAMLEGCGLIAEVARYRTIQDILAYILYWIALWSGLGLLAVPILQIVRLTASLLWLSINYHKFVLTVFQFKIPHVELNWWREVWPMHWKIALSWISGYFIFYFFNPVLFAYFGAAEAGKMGMSLALTNALLTVSTTWVNTKIPIFGQLIALKKYSELDHLFFRSVIQASSISVLGSIFLLTGLVILQYFHLPLGSRLLNPLPFSFLLGIAILNVIISSEAVYLRAHKEEPFLLNSIVGAIMIALATYYVGRAYGALGMASATLVLTAIIGLCWGTWIFINKRKSWHGA